MLTTAAILVPFVVAVCGQPSTSFGPMLRLGQPIRKLGDVVLVPVFEPLQEGDPEISTNEIDSNIQVPASYARLVHILGGRPDSFNQQQYQVASPPDVNMQQGNSLRRQRRSPGAVYGGYGGGGCHTCGGGVGYVPQGGISHGGGGGNSYSTSQAQASSSSSSGSYGGGGGGYGRK